jgi:hypothetical protein
MAVMVLGMAMAACGGDVGARDAPLQEPSVPLPLAVLVLAILSASIAALCVCRKPNDLLGQQRKPLPLAPEAPAHASRAQLMGLMALPELPPRPSDSIPSGHFSLPKSDGASDQFYLTPPESSRASTGLSATYARIDPSYGFQTTLNPGYQTYSQMPTLVSSPTSSLVPPPLPPPLAPADREAVFSRRGLIQEEEFIGFPDTLPRPSGADLDLEGYLQPRPADGDNHDDGL